MTPALPPDSDVNATAMEVSVGVARGQFYKVYEYSQQWESWYAPTLTASLVTAWGSFARAGESVGYGRQVFDPYKPGATNRGIGNQGELRGFLGVVAQLGTRIEHGPRLGFDLYTASSSGRTELSKTDTVMSYAGCGVALSYVVAVRLSANLFAVIEGTGRAAIAGDGASPLLYDARLLMGVRFGLF
jgi:hypothetical protein